MGLENLEEGFLLLPNFPSPLSRAWKEERGFRESEGVFPRAKALGGFD